MTPVSVHHSKPKPKNWWPCHHVLKPSQKWPQNLIIWALSLFDTEHVNNHFADENTIFPSTDYVYSWIWPMHLNICDCVTCELCTKLWAGLMIQVLEDYRRRCSKFKVKSDEYSSTSPYKQLLICSSVNWERLFLILIQFIAYSALRPTIQIATIWIWVWNEYECERMWLKWWFLHFVVRLLDWACLIQYKHPKAWSPEGEIL